jgi:hypothetical protein
MPATLFAADPPLISRAGTHMIVEARRLFGVDQPHRALGKPFGSEEGIVGGGDDVDDGIADREHVEAGVGHKDLSIGEERPRPSPAAGADQPHGCGDALLGCGAPRATRLAFLRPGAQTSEARGTR